MTPETFDPKKIGRYTVIRVYYEYQDQEPGEKLFIALKHQTLDGKTFCWCIKATSQIQRFPDSKAPGIVHIEAGKISFFPKETVVDPSNFITMLHQTLSREALLGRYSVEGTMPTGFHENLVAAIRASKTLEPKKKVVLLACIGEKLDPADNEKSGAK